VLLLINRHPLQTSTTRSTSIKSKRSTFPSPIPPLSSLINNETVIDEVDFLLDFAIIGHCKTGTTFLAKWLGSHSEITNDLLGKERHYLTTKQPFRMVEYLHSLPGDQLRAFKAPRDVYNIRVVELLAKYFPSAKLIVGLRHPIEYFESFYNYRIARGNCSMPPAELLIGKCMRDLPNGRERRKRQEQLNGLMDQGVCTDSANFHVHLSYLGKTTLYENNSDYRQLLQEDTIAWRQRPVVPNPVFVYEARQLSDATVSFRRDLTNFLGLHEPLQPVALDSEASNVYQHLFLDICQPTYGMLRRELLANGRLAAEWIQRYFFNAPGVTISDKNVFVDLLKDWSKDPCLTKLKDSLEAAV
jgi:hypothetical protein